MIQAKTDPALQRRNNALNTLAPNGAWFAGSYPIGSENWDLKTGQIRTSPDEFEGLNTGEKIGKDYCVIYTPNTVFHKTTLKYGVSINQN